MLLSGIFPLNHTKIHQACVNATQAARSDGDRSYWQHQVETLDAIGEEMSRTGRLEASVSAARLYDMPEDYWKHRGEWTRACLLRGDYVLGLALGGVCQPKSLFFVFGIDDALRERFATAMGRDRIKAKIRNAIGHINPFWDVNEADRRAWREAVSTGFFEERNMTMSLQIPISERIDNEIINEIAKDKAKKGLVLLSSASDEQESIALRVLLTFLGTADQLLSSDLRDVWQDEPHSHTRAMRTSDHGLPSGSFPRNGIRDGSGPSEPVYAVNDADRIDGSRESANTRPGMKC